MGQEVQDLFLASYFLGCFILRAAKIKSQPVNICQQTAKGITYFTCLVVTVIPKTFCKMKSLSFLFLLSFLIPVSASAQKPAVTAYAPTREEIARRYKRANELDTLARRSVFKTNVTPNWSGASSFWYRNILADSIPEYMFVDPVKNTKHVLFDPVKLAAALTEATKKTVDQRKLALKDIYVYPGANKIAIATGIVFYDVDLVSYQLSKIDSLPVDATPYPTLSRATSRWQRGRFERISPDKKWTATIKDYNIFIAPAEGGDGVAYTTDGTQAIPYTDLSWSPDSRYLVTYKVKRVVDKPVYYILTSQPGTTRGELKQQPYKQPGDDFSTYEMFLVSLGDKVIKKVNTDIIDFFDAPRLHWNDDDPAHFMYERVDRGHQRFRIIEVNANDASTRNIVDEQTQTFIYEQRIYTYYLPATSEVLWVTEKDGWRHIYLVDAKNATIKNAVTAGEWVVRSVDSVDIKKREIWFQASGMNVGEDPYNVHYYRIGFDGKKLVTLTQPGYNHRLVYSPDKQYFVDIYSTVNQPTTTILCKTADGKKVMDIERADVANYSKAGFKFPEVFHAKGRDGKTDIWGVICRPTDFDPKKTYPIIENIYAGPQDAFVPKTFSPFGEMQSMAELGFIVVQIDGMGTANRSKAFHDVCWKNLGDAGFPDRIAWMRAMAQKYPQADTARVGLYGTSAGGQNSLGGLLFHPEWYKAAVSAAGCHDNRVDKQWWNEQWMGYPVGKHYDEQSNITNAHKLKGKLLLIVGEADTNVPPESTYRVADALIKANKTYDFLVVPGMGHSDGGPYGRAKKRDFFVKSLLGVDAPDRNNN
jgi:dipeptidyl aminopeptidase/acylaminoacyl peptidase